jgi:2-methylisocitrate lyase-like PEP mutase family enzyme
LAVSRALAGVPLVANMVEGGKTELLDNAELQELGYRIVLYPNSLVRLFGRAGAELLATLRRAGTTRSEQKAMLSFAELNDLVGQREHAAREAQFLGQPGTGETNAGARAPGEMR